MACPGQALVNPDTDALAVAQLTGPWQAVSRAASAGPIPVAPQPWSAQTCSASACTVSLPAGVRKGLCTFEPGAGQRRLRPNHSRRRAGQRPRLHLVAVRQPDRSRPECDNLRRRVGVALAAGGDRPPPRWSTCSAGPGTARPSPRRPQVAAPQIVTFEPPVSRTAGGQIVSLFGNALDSVTAVSSACSQPWSFRPIR